MKEHKKYLSIFAALLLAVFAIVCVFGVACNKKDDEDPEEQPPAEEHVHDYTVLNYDESGHWYECSANDGAKTDPESHAYGSYTVDKAATCTENGSESAKCSVCGYTDTRVIEAVGHTYPNSDDAENVDWDWTGRTETAVTLTVTCTECGDTLVHEDVEYSDVEGEDEETLIGATYTVTVEGEDGYTYESTYDTADDANAEHHHHYGEPTWEWTAVEGEDETGYTVKATFTCESIVGTAVDPDEEELEVKAEVTSEITTAVTCTEDGEITYTATVKFNGETYTDEKTEEIAATGHVCDYANPIWSWVIDENETATATLTFNCSVCGEVAFSESTTDPISAVEGVYTANMTGPDGNTYTDTYEIIKIPTEYHIDFSDPDTYSWIGYDAVDGQIKTESTYGIITIPVSSKMTIGKELDNSLNTGGKASETAGEAIYIKLDLSEFVGQYVSITVTMCSNEVSDNPTARTLVINNSVSSSNPLASVSSIVKDANQLETLSYSAEITNANKILYITCDKSVNIFTIDIVISDENPDYCSCTTPSYPEVTDTEHVVWDWAGRDEDKSEVSVTIYCTECGKIIETVTANYTVDQNVDTKWTASAEAGGNTYTSTFDIPVEGEKATTESFIVPKKSGDDADSQIYSAGDKVVSNSLFELTTVDSMKYATGGTGSNNISSVTLTDINGETHTFDQALESGTTLTPTITATETQTDDEGNESQVATAVTAASNDDILEVKAIADATVYIYLTLTNDGYSVHPSGTIYYTINDGEKVSFTVSSRTTITTLTLELSAGDIVKIGAEHSTLNSAKTTAQSLHIWLFGAEAISAGSSSGESEVGLPKVSVNFSDSSTYTWINDYVKDTETGEDTSTISNGKTFYDGILSLVSSSGTGTGMQIDGSGSTYYLRTGGGTQSSGRSFAIDLLSYAGKYVSISVVFCTQSNNSERSLMLSKSSSTSSIDSTDVIAYASNSSNSGSATRTTFSYILPVTGETLYLTFSAEIRIYSIEIEVLDEAEPTVTGWTVALTPDTTSLTYVDESTPVTATLTLTISMEGEDDAVYAGGYSILSSDTAVVTVAEDEDGNIVVTAVGNGEATITVRLWDDPEKYATVTVTVTGFPADEEAG